MAKINRNSKEYNASLITGVYDLEVQNINPKMGRCNILYDVSTENATRLKFLVDDDDGSRVVHICYLRGKSFQEIPSIFFTSIESDSGIVGIDVFFTGFNLKKI
jgi:hypothetical protein